MPKFKSIYLLLIISIVLFVVTFKLLREYASSSNQAQDGNSDGILMIVLTTEETILTNGLAVSETWGRDYSRIVFVCVCENVKRVQEMVRKEVKIPKELNKYKKVAHLPVISFDVNDDAKGASSRKVNRKIYEVIKTVYSKYKSLVKWFFLVDDDTYVFTRNLVRFTSARNHTLASMHGFKWELKIVGGLFSGVLLSKQAMKQISSVIKIGNCDKYLDNTFIDHSINKCAQSVDISIDPSHDEFDKPRFHPDNVNAFFRGAPLPEAYYNAGSHPNVIGKECCSVETISFNSVSVSDMRKMYSNNMWFLEELLT